jgi:hypothetical protein
MCWLNNYMSNYRKNTMWIPVITLHYIKLHNSNNAKKKKKKKKNYNNNSIKFLFIYMQT